MALSFQSDARVPVLTSDLRKARQAVEEPSFASWTRTSMSLNWGQWPIFLGVFRVFNQLPGSLLKFNFFESRSLDCGPPAARRVVDGLRVGLTRFEFDRRAAEGGGTGW